MSTIGGLGLYIGWLSVNYWPTISWWSTSGRLIHDRYFLHTWPVLDRYFTGMWSLCKGRHTLVDYWLSISPPSVNCPLIDRPRPPIAHMIQVSYTWSVAQSRAGILVNNHQAQLLAVRHVWIAFYREVEIAMDLSHLCNSTTGDNQNPCTFIEEQLQWTKINNQAVI